MHSVHPLRLATLKREWGKRKSLKWFISYNFANGFSFSAHWDLQCENWKLKMKRKKGIATTIPVENNNTIPGHFYLNYTFGLFCFDFFSFGSFLAIFILDNFVKVPIFAFIFQNPLTFESLVNIKHKYKRKGKNCLGYSGRLLCSKSKGCSGCNDFKLRYDCNYCATQFNPGENVCWSDIQ